MSGTGSLMQNVLLLSLAVLLGSCTTTELLRIRQSQTQQEQAKPTPKLLAQADKTPTLGLPLHGNFRFAVPKEAQSFDEIASVPGPNGGYIDRFGNEWVLTPFGKYVFWKQILSEEGRFRLSGLITSEEQQRGYIFIRRFDGGKVTMKGRV
jgi:hypothetical protein